MQDSKNMEIDEVVNAILLPVFSGIDQTSWISATCDWKIPWRSKTRLGHTWEIGH